MAEPTNIGLYSKILKRDKHFAGLERHKKVLKYWLQDTDYILRIDLIPQGEYRFQGFGGLTRIVFNRLNEKSGYQHKNNRQLI
jgi:hypothetical protein